MPHRPEDTESTVSRPGHDVERPGESRSEAVEPTRDGPRSTADTQPPRPGGRSYGGKIPSHGSRR